MKRKLQTQLFTRTCDYCDKEMPPYTEHIKYNGLEACCDCFEEGTTTSYFVGGEFVGTDDDEITHVYSWEDDPEEGE